ncbi:response regulator, partial [bacterium]|nr:response regulator [bacterium]
MSNGKIVIVDDEKIVTSAFKMLLQVEGFGDVHDFNNPLDAIEYIKNEKPDLIVSDFMMPEMNGLEFLREAKTHYPETSMILLTGYADKENAIKAINEIGLYKYIEKPWDNDDLIMNIRNGIERSHLLENLRNKISELDLANKKLEEYSSNLEKLVQERTKDLSVANAKLSGIITYCADGILIINSKGEIEQVNPAVENLTGLDEKSLIKKKFQEIAFVNSKDLNSSFDNKNGNILGLGEDKSEILLRDCNIINSLSGENIPVEVSFALISDDNKSNVKYVGVIRNITEQKETEKLRDDFIATL